MLEVKGLSSCIKSISQRLGSKTVEEIEIVTRRNKVVESAGGLLRVKSLVVHQFP